MSSSFSCLDLGSHDLSQAENEITACKIKQIHKVTTIFGQNDNLKPVCCKKRQKIVPDQLLVWGIRAI